AVFLLVRGNMCVAASGMTGWRHRVGLIVYTLLVTLYACISAFFPSHLHGFTLQETGPVGQ
ncbi:hypothetical protein, partial [Pseudomonas sp. MD330_11]|uniref:hypothetical protein n=1 Tax=Pseudomonas sp. MD330_11 TaxID=3241255 RepID=UPI0036D3AE42